MNTIKSIISCFKRIFGEKVRTRGFKGKINEIKARFKIMDIKEVEGGGDLFCYIIS